MQKSQTPLQKPHRRRAQPASESSVATCGLCNQALERDTVTIGIKGSVHRACFDEIQQKTAAIIEKAKREGQHSDRAVEPPENGFQRAGRLSDGFKYSHLQVPRKD